MGERAARTEPVVYDHGMDADAAIRALVALRSAVGVSTWATPGLAGSLFGLKPRDNPQAPYLARLFAVRDLALAVGAAQSSGAPRRQWLQLGLACDVADAAAAVLGGRAGYLSKPVAGMLFAPAAGAAALGVLGLREPATAAGPAAPAA